MKISYKEYISESKNMEDYISPIPLGKIPIKEIVGFWMTE